MKPTIYRTIAALALICSCISVSNAQDSLKVLDALYMDFSIPDMTAFSLLGVSPNKVSRPASTKEFAADLLSIAQSGGKSISPGIALEWAPLMTFDKLNVSGNAYADFRAYKKSSYKRNIQFTFASTQDSLAARIAFGASYIIFDNGDPSNDPIFLQNIFAATSGLVNKLSGYNKFRENFDEHTLKPALEELNLPVKDYPEFYTSLPLSFKKQVDESNRSELEKPFITKLGYPSGSGDAREAKVRQLISRYLEAAKIYFAMQQDDQRALSKYIDTAKAKYKKEHWNAGILKVGVGNIWYSPDFTWGHLQSNKFSGYGAWAFKMWKWGQGILLGQYTTTYNADAQEKSMGLIGARVLAGNNKVHGSLEGAWQTDTFREIKGIKKDNTNTLRATLGLELRISEGLWIEMATGINGPSSDFFKSAKMLTFGNVKYTFKKESRYNVY